MQRNEVKYERVREKESSFLMKLWEFAKQMKKLRVKQQYWKRKNQPKNKMKRQISSYFEVIDVS